MEIDKVNTRALVPANPSNDRGLRTWKWGLTTVYFRQQGEVFGGHFHEGIDPSKDPEKFLLLTGTVEVSLEDQEGHNRSFVLAAGSGPVELAIPPRVLHTLVALVDCWFIENRVTPFNPELPDTYLREDFRKLN